MRLFVCIVLCAILLGCVPKNPPPPIYAKDGVSMPTIIQWSTWERFAPERWLLEAKKRWNDPIVFICHGGCKTVPGTVDGKPSFVNKWYACPDAPRKQLEMQEVARMLHNLYPDKDIVLVSCNDMGVDLNVPRVWYAQHSVWQMPDGYSSLPLLQHEQMVGYGDVGTVWEFVTMGGKRQPATQPTTRLTVPSL